ncbi:MAG: hypothetical protein Q4B70_11560 [Lachnospiraceae bacterium]|nr:hypothetical protein [Lachnospiraceae bacterium]
MMENRRLQYRKIQYRIVAFILTLCFGLATVFSDGICVLAASDKKAEASETTDKTETVYGEADAKGNVTDITVEATLKKQDNDDIIKDYSTLSDIKNVKGDEEFTQTEDGEISWENQGEAIRYEGKSEEELPVSVKLTYYLDGEEIEPEALAGQSGKVKIRFDYENKLTKKVKVDGKELSVAVPFVMFSTMFLPEETFSNISVTNGKLVSMDDQSLVVGYACPGLKDSLKLDSFEATEDMDIPEYVEVTADVTEFELAFTATAASSGIFEEIDTSDLNDADDLTDSMEELSDASGQLADGAVELWKGTGTFKTYVSQYVKGVSSADQGLLVLKKSMKTLNEKKAELEKGATSLESGLSTFSTALSGISIPSGDSEKQKAALLAATELSKDAKTLSEKLAGIEEELAKIRTAISDAKSFSETVSQSVSLAKEKLSATSISDGEAAANQKAKEQAAAAVEASLEGSALSTDEINKVKESVVSSIDVSGTLATLEQQIKDATSALDQIPEYTMPELTVETDGITSVIGDMQTRLETISSWSEEQEALATNLTALSTALKTLQTSAESLKTGSSQLKTGISAFNQGVLQIYQGTVKLKKGTSKLSTAGKSLITGAESLTKGAKALKEGMLTFDEEGMESLSDLAGDDLSNVIRRVKALKKAEKSYTNYSGLADGMTGSVKFVIETEEIEKN